MTFPARGTWIEMSPYISAAASMLRTFPARGTWIEIEVVPVIEIIMIDVPRKGNVDRNGLTPPVAGWTQATFPARGTWIEI